MAARRSCRLVNIAQSRKIPEDGSTAGKGAPIYSAQRREVLESLASRGIQICKVGLSQLPQTVVMVPHLLAKRDTKGEESCMWRTSLRTNHMWSFPHVSPDLYCRSIHVQKPYSVTTLTPQAVDANRP
jgi:hypothetical protein